MKLARASYLSAGAASLSVASNANAEVIELGLNNMMDGREDLTRSVPFR